MQTNARVRFAEALRKSRAISSQVAGTAPILSTDANPKGIVSEEKDCDFDERSFFSHDDDREAELSSGDEGFHSCDDFASSDDDTSIESEASKFTPTSFSTESSSLAKKEKSPASSDIAMKLAAMSVTLIELANLICSRSCRFGGSCLEKASLVVCRQFKDFMWNPINSSAPSSTDRRNRIQNVLRRSFCGHVKSIAKFSFFLEDPSMTVGRRVEESLPRKRIEICEGSYVVLLGLSPSMEKPIMWRRIRADIASGCELKLKRPGK